MYTFRLKITLTASFLILHDIGVAQVSTDGTTGDRRALSAPDYQIDAELGTEAGGNLFHSFEQFSLDTGESATFVGPGGIENIISRVTGGELSAIDGLIASTIPGASLWLFNPSGVVFGPNASLDVDGSFHVSTADELRMADGGRFSAIDPGADSLSVAPPEAFGFLGADPAGITIAGSELEIGEGGTLSVVGGDVDIAGASLATAGGALNVLAVDGPAEADVASGELRGDAGGDITLQASALTSTGDGGGTIRIEGGAFVVDQASTVTSINDGATDGDVGIDIDTATVEIAGGSLIEARALDEGDGGSIAIAADDIDLLDGAQIASSTDSSGSGADIALAGEDVRISGSASIVSFTSAGGDSGSIDIDAEDLTLTNGSIVAGTEETASGDGGDIDIAAGSVELAVFDPELGSLISAVTFGSGRGGDIAISGGRLLVDGSNSVAEATISSVSGSTSGGASGQVRLDLEELILARGGNIFGDASGSSEGSASIDIDASDIDIDGSGEGLTGISIRAGSTGNTGGVVVVRGDDIDIRNGGLISTTTDTDLDASDILIVTDRLSLSGQGALFDTQIVSDASVDATGSAGSIDIIAENVYVSGDGAISSSSLGAGDAGRIDILATDSLQLRDDGEIETSVFNASTADAGSIAIRTPDLTLLETSVITSSTSGIGSAGTISIESERITIEDRRNDGVALTGISTSADVGSGDAGAIVIVADSLTLLGDDSEIQSFNDGEGAAGTIDIRLTTDLLLGKGADILTLSASGGGGGITIVADRSITTTGPDSVITTTVADDTGNAGDIVIETPVLALGGSRILARADAGIGGDIQISVDDLLLSPDALIDAQAGATGVDGTIAVSASEVDLTGGLTAFDGRFLDVSSLLRERCAARRANESSSFTLGAGGSLPADLDAPTLSLVGTKPNAPERRTILVLPCPKAAS